MSDKKPMTVEELSGLIYDILGSSDPTTPTYKKMRIAELVLTFSAKEVEKEKQAQVRRETSPENMARLKAIINKAVREVAEPLLEALEKIATYTSFNGDKWPADIAVKSIATFRAKYPRKES